MEFTLEIAAKLCYNCSIMKICKKTILFFLTIAAVSLSGCRDYNPSNEPRHTAAEKENVLTTVTSIETSRPETYSEYISSLREMESSIREEAAQTIGGMERDTAVSREETETAQSMERVTAVSKETGDRSETAVTTVPTAESGDDVQTVTCTKKTEKTESSVTSPILDLSDIPAVPSDRVKADTSLADTSLADTSLSDIP